MDKALILALLFSGCISAQGILGQIMQPQPVAGGGTVTFDAVGPSASGQSGTGVATTWTHTVGAGCTSTFIAVGVATGTTTTGATSVTAGALSLTKAGSIHSNNSATDGLVELWYGVGVPTGAVTMTVNGIGSTQASFGSVSLCGVNQSAPIQNTTTNAGTGTSPAVTVTSATGHMVVDIMCIGATVTSSNKTSRWINNTGAAGGGACGGGAQSTAAGASSVAMGYTVANDWWGIVAFDVKP